VNVTGKFELDMYLTKTPLEPKYFPKLDVLAIGRIDKNAIQIYVD